MAEWTEIFEVTRKLNLAEARVKELEQRNLDWESLEGELCPEDVGFKEYIGALQKHNAALTLKVKGLQNMLQNYADIQALLSPEGR